MDIAKKITDKLNFDFDADQLKEILPLFYNMCKKAWEVILYFSLNDILAFDNKEKEISKLFIVKDDLTSNDVDLLQFINKCKRNGELVFKVVVSTINAASHIEINNFYLFDFGAVIVQKENNRFQVFFTKEKVIEYKKIFQELVNISLQEKTKFELKEPLSASADYCYHIAKREYTKDYVDSESCAWYHSIWQYLRLLDMVSSPEWHADFYISNFIKILEQNVFPRILISGTADYSMLAYIIYCCQITRNKADIYVIDLCNTPLNMCNWYAQRENINITVINDDILKHNFGDIKFDLICTDAFLTRFTEPNVYNIISTWKKLLKPNGNIVTTVRVRENKRIKDSHLSSDDLKMKYVEEACFRFEKWKHFLSISYTSFKDAVLHYVNHMSSSNLGSYEDVLQLINDCSGNIISYNFRITTGELEVTKYLEVVFS